MPSAEKVSEIREELVKIEESLPIKHLQPEEEEHLKELRCMHFLSYCLFEDDFHYVLCSLFFTDNFLMRDLKLKHLKDLRCKGFILTFW